MRYIDGKIRDSLITLFVSLTPGRSSAAGEFSRNSALYQWTVGVPTSREGKNVNWTAQQYFETRGGLSKLEVGRKLMV